MVRAVDWLLEKRKAIKAKISENIQTWIMLGILIPLGMRKDVGQLGADN